MEKPNVVVLFADDQRYDTIAALGNSEIKTPHLDRLAERGTSFTHAHIPCGTVGAVCMPSRAMLHTGRSLYHLGTEADPDNAGATIPPEHTLMGEAFAKAGYQTFGTGKWHNGPEAFNRSFAAGAEIMFGGMADHWNVPMCDYDPSGAYDNKEPVIYDPYSSNTVDIQHVDHIHPGSHSTDLIADAAIDFIRGGAAPGDGASGGSTSGQEAPAPVGGAAGRPEPATPARPGTAAPFFAYVSFLAPHDPRSMPKRFLDMYDPASIGVPDSYVPEHPFDFGVSDIRDELLEEYPRTEAAIRRHIAEYYAMITHLDDAIGRIVEALEESGVLDNTIVVFAGDNGLAVGRHGLMGKQSNYDHSVRVPLIFAGPGLAAGATTESYAYLFDVFPTLCDLTGVETPASVEGASLAPLVAPATEAAAGGGAASPGGNGAAKSAIGKGGEAGREALYFGYGDLLRSAKDQTHKLILYAHGGRNYLQLFDLEADPAERKNIAGLPETATVQAALLERLMALREEWGDRATTWGREFWNRFEQNGGAEGAHIVRSTPAVR